MNLLTCGQVDRPPFLPAPHGGHRGSGRPELPGWQQCRVTGAARREGNCWGSCPRGPRRLVPRGRHTSVRGMSKPREARPGTPSARSTPRGTEQRQAGRAARVWSGTDCHCSLWRLSGREGVSSWEVPLSRVVSSQVASLGQEARTLGAPYIPVTLPQILSALDLGGSSAARTPEPGPPPTPRVAVAAWKCAAPESLLDPSQALL